MKTILLAALLTLVVGCVTAQTPSVKATKEKAIETAILWTAEKGDDWRPIGMSEYVSDTTLFAQEGNFYKPKQKLVLFGHEALYVGMLGVELVPGPNATLKGTPKEIAASITKEHGLKFRDEEGTWVCDYRENIKIVVMKHPNLKGTSILIGAYLGE